MIKVYHAVNPNFGWPTEERPNPTWPEGYVLVAEVDTNSKEKAFELTNTIDRGWWENEGVKCLVGQTRSTSVGDIVTTEDGKIWLCEALGWKEITAN